MFEFAGKVAVITGAASGFGRAFAKKGASLGMKLVLADVDPDALAQTVEHARAAGAEAIGVPTDVSDAAQVEALAQAALDAFGARASAFQQRGRRRGRLRLGKQRERLAWVFGVNVMGVANGVRAFTPIMLAQNEPAHIVNTASVAGLLAAPAMGVYNASKHAVVGADGDAVSRPAWRKSRAAGGQVGCSLLCPAFVPTGIADAERARPDGPAQRQRRRRARRSSRASNCSDAVQAGKLSAAEVAEITFEAIAERRFYVDHASGHHGVGASCVTRTSSNCAIRPIRCRSSPK